MHKCVALEAFAAFAAVQPFFKHSAVDAETAANGADFGTIFADTAIAADQSTAYFYTFAALGAKPIVVFTANRTVVAAGFALTVNLKAFVAFNTVVIDVAFTAKLAIGADVFAVIANSAFLTVYFAEIAETAIGAGLAVCLVAFHAHFTAIFANCNTIFAEVTFRADKCTVLAEVAAVTAVNIRFDIASITVGTDIDIIVTFNAKQMVAAFTSTDTFYTAKAFFADGVFVIPALTAVGASQVIL